jgi:predicted RecA/RadA family phage recombinase
MNVTTPMLGEQAAVHQQQYKVAQSVNEIAEAFSLPRADVQDMLTGEMNQLEQKAKIQQYILILSVKTVKDFLAASRCTGV